MEEARLIFVDRPIHAGVILLTVFFSVIVFAKLFATLSKKKTGRNYNYPPGPRGWPIVGNAFQIDQNAPGLTCKALGEKHGEMSVLHVHGSNSLGLCKFTGVGSGASGPSRKAVHQPPPSPGYLGYIVGWKADRAYGAWRALAKPTESDASATDGSHADEFMPYQDVESRKLLWDYYVAPEKYYLHGARFANSVIFSVVFGRRTSMQEQPVQELFSTIEDFMEMQRSPSANLIDSFPTLAKLIPRPLQWYRPHAERVFRKTVKTYETFFDDLEQRLINGQDPRCFAREMNKIAYKYGFDENQRYYCAGTIIEAGSDTTRNQLNIMIAAAAKFPAWVKIAQEELDSVYGDAERLPSFDDWNSLPYIKAVIKESLRWRPNMTAFGAPRVLIEDDAIGPYVFEKGTIFTYNHWGLSHNEAVHKDNEVFRPERYLDADIDDMLKGHFGFGLGRRVCPGYHVGARNMFIAFARILYCYRFEEDPQAPIDDRRIEPQAHETAPFKIEIIPRSEKHVELIQKECRAAGIAVD